MSKRSIVLGVVAILLVAALAVAGPVVAAGPGSGGGGGGYGGGGGGYGGGGGGGGGTPGGGGGGGEGEEPSAVNNLSFPAIGVDGYSLAAVPESFLVEYAGTYPGLTPEEIAALGSGPWYPQKTAGNTWQADFVKQAAVDVSYIDWGDNIESVNPKIRRPFRLEVVLFKQLDAPMERYTMAELEYPSSSNELQGTNKVKTDSYLATVASDLPKLVVQYYGASVPENMGWTGTQWTSGTVVPVSFSTELNVGGKLIYGASQGGWTPDQIGYYRITFYSPAGSGVNLALAEVGNYADFSVPPSSELAFSAESEGGDEGGVATPVVVPGYNLSYVDVQAATGGGKRH